MPTPPPTRPFDPTAAERAIAFGREGLSRAEVAAALGASLADFEAWAAASPGFAAALADADTLARAWWDAQPRLALSSGRMFKATAWAKAVAQRYGRSADRPSQTARAAAERPKVKARFVLPDNGRERRPPRARS